MRNKRSVRNFALIALALVLIAAGLTVYTVLTSESDREETLPTPSQLMFNIRPLGERTIDTNKLRREIGSDKKYASFAVRSEFTLYFQLRNAEELAAFAEKSGMKGELPDVDFDSSYLLVSTGRSIINLNKNLSKTTADGELVAYMEYSDEYRGNVAYLYSMNRADFLSGEALERYYWSVSSEFSNLYELSEDSAKVLSEGKYHKVLDYGDGSPVCIFVDVKGHTSLRLVADSFISVNEYNDELVELKYGENTIYFDPSVSQVSTDYAFPTHYFTGKIVWYMRNYHEEELQLILRDAFDQTHYAKIVRLDFSTGVEDLDSLTKNVEYVDNTHVRVTYIGGDDKVVRTTVEEVYPIER